MEKSSRHRYHSAGELAEELGRFLNQEPIHARPASFVRKLVVWTRRRPGQLAALAALVFSGLVGGVYYLAQENAFLRALQTTPGLLREPGARVEALKTWGMIPFVVFNTGLLFTVWLIKRIRGTPRRSSDDDLSVQPFNPLGGRVRILAICIGVLVTLFSLAYGMRLIEVYVWEGDGHVHNVVISYLTAWIGLWLLVIAAADFRRSLFGTPQRTLTSEQKDEIERALFQRDVREAIRLYQQAFSDADRAEACAFVSQRFEEISRQRPREFAAAAPKLWDLNWRTMALCALIEVPIVAAFWLVMQPANPFGVAVGCGLGAAFGLGVAVGNYRLVGFRKRFLRATLPLVFVLIIGAALADHAGARVVFGPFMFLGLACGTVLMNSGFTPKRRQPNSS